jgi:hypothetical protein
VWSVDYGRWLLLGTRSHHWCAQRPMLASFSNLYFLQDLWFDWLIIYGFTSRSRIFHLYGDVTIASEGLQNFWPMLCAQGLWARRGLYRATPAVTRDLGFFGLIWRTAPISCLLRHTWGCGGSIITRILTGLQDLWDWWLFDMYFILF